jgi:uncharacterized protein YecE (DUF72 family)
MNAKVHIGTQGWNYDGWVGPFYPTGTRKREMLELYSKIFDTVEIDSTFYAIPSEASVRGWAERTPADFLFSLKLTSEITHKARLRDCEELLLQFVERALILREKLGSVLIQMPPDFSPDERPALNSFLKLLPGDVRFSIEFRDEAWLTEATLAALAEQKVALALTDSRWIARAESIRLIEAPTAPFAYVRWLGPRELTDYSRVQINRERELQQWAEGFKLLTEEVRIVFGYFNNHFQGHSPASSNDFKKRLGLKVVSPSSLITQPSLFQ